MTEITPDVAELAAPNSRVCVLPNRVDAIVAQLTAAPPVLEGSLDERIRVIVREAKAEMSRERAAMQRLLPQGHNLDQADVLWQLTRDALVLYALRRDLPLEHAHRYAAIRMLQADR